MKVKQLRHEDNLASPEPLEDDGHNKSNGRNQSAAQGNR